MHSQVTIKLDVQRFNHWLATALQASGNTHQVTHWPTRLRSNPAHRIAVQCGMARTCMRVYTHASLQASSPQLQQVVQQTNLTGRLQTRDANAVKAALWEVHDEHKRLFPS